MEVGSGTGGNLAMLSDFGRLFAMELNPEARALSDRRSIIKAEEGILPDGIPFGNQQFDLIAALTCSNILNLTWKAWWRCVPDWRSAENC